MDRTQLARLLLAVALGLPASSPEAAAPVDAGVLSWRSVPSEYRWVLGWQPLAAQAPDGTWAASSPEAPPAVDAVYAASDAGRFAITDWDIAFTDCETLQVALGTWEPGSPLPETAWPGPLLALSEPGWKLWLLEDPATVWKRPGRPEQLGAALNGLAAVTFDAFRKRLPRMLEPDPDTAWRREPFKLAASWAGESVELVGTFLGAVRMRGQGRSSPAVLHYWVGYENGRHQLRAAWVDLPEGGEVFVEHELLGIVQPAGGERPQIFAWEHGPAARRLRILEPGVSGAFEPVLVGPWTGCDPP